MVMANGSKIKYAAFTVQMPEYDLEQVYQKLSAFGFDGVEWRVKEVPAKAPDLPPPKELWYWQYNKATLDVDNLAQYEPSIKRWTEQYGIEPLSLTSYLEPDQHESIRAVCLSAGRMGFRMIRVFPCRYTGERHYRDLFDQARKDLRVLEQIAAETGVEINLEMHHETIIPSASAARRLLEGCDPARIGLIYDSGNMVFEGYEQYGMGLELLGEYLHHIHIKDAGWTIDHSRPRTYEAKWSPIGQGAVDFAALAKAIRSVGYDRYISFEDFSGKQSCDEKLINSLAYMKSLL